MEGVNYKVDSFCSFEALRDELKALFQQTLSQFLICCFWGMKSIPEDIICSIGACSNWPGITKERCFYHTSPATSLPWFKKSWKRGRLLEEMWSSVLFDSKRQLITPPPPLRLPSCAEKVDFHNFLLWFYNAERNFHCFLLSNFKLLYYVNETLTSCSFFVFEQ